MTTKSGSGESKESRALTALARLGRDEVERPTSAELERGLNTLMTRIAAGRMRRRNVARWSLVGATALACALIGLGIAAVFRSRAPAPERPALAYQVEGGRVLEGGYLRESGDSGVNLLFNEGSRVALRPGARGRLRAVDQQGARVAIDQGTASFQVTPSSERRWWVEVGPFLVEVKGTVFTVSWDPPSERFSLSLRAGRVVVSGPLTDGNIALRAGQRLTVSLPKAETLIAEEKPEALVDDSSDASVPQAEAPPSLPDGDEEFAKAHASAPRTATSGAKAEGKRRWADQVANGHWDRILEEVERAGVEPTLERASSEDLFAVAAAARYRRRTELARAALLAERRRFPSSPRSLDATFLLGRVEESREGGKARAIEWYNEYLARAATGTYTAEALGRKMILTDELQGEKASRPIAEEYLRRFPGGSYAGWARAHCRLP